jgi:hypothetical protein
MAKIGRPTRATRSATALVGVDLSKVDPVAVLRSIAADVTAPATARVQAARALLAYVKEDTPETLDPVTAAAIKTMASPGRRAN